MNSILDKHLPLKRLSKQEILQRDQPWITKGLTKSIKIKNIHRKMRRAKDLIRKEELSNTYKTYKNKILKLTQLSKANHFNRFVIENKTNLLKVWKGIKSSINTKPSKTKQSITTL